LGQPWIDFPAREVLVAGVDGFELTPIDRHRKLPSSKAMVVSVAEKSGQEPGRQG
jgi:hypothetical protein